MRPGDVIADRFEVVSLASAGGMGTVYSALDRSTGVRAAVKMLHAFGSEYVSLFDREARVLAELSHPGIVRYIAHGSTADGDMYLAMEWLEGEDLAERLLGGALGIDETLVLAQKVSEAMAAAHARGIVHRDIKPSNLFLREREADKVKLLDFGVARSRAGTRPATLTGAIVGTPGYIAPEQALGAKELDPRADIFSLGCVLFECLTGRPAFEGEHVMVLLSRILLGDAPRVREVRADVPEAFDALVSRMLSKDPKSRPADGSELREELQAVEASWGPRAPSLATASRAARRAGEADTLPVAIPRPHVDASADGTAGDEEDSTVESVVEAAVVSTTPQLLGEPAPFVARTREIAAIEAALALAARETTPRAMFITGPPGIGKSRLLAEIAQRFWSRSDGPTVWRGNGDPIGASSPFRMITGLLHRALGLPPKAPSGGRKPRLERHIFSRVQRRISGPEQRRVAEFLGEIMGIPFAHGGSVALRAARQDARLMGDQMKRAFEDWVRVVAQGRPLVILLDDVQWADRPSLDLLDLVLRNGAGTQVLIVAFAQPDVHTRHPNLWAGTIPSEVSLGRLSTAESELLVRKALHLEGDDEASRRRTRVFAKFGTTVGPDEISSIVQGAGGNPQRLEEMLRAVVFGVGDRVDGDVAARIAALPNEARRRLEAASVFGLEHSEDGVTAVLKDTTDTIALSAWVGSRQWLLELMRQELIAQTGAPIAKEYAFRHPLVRAAAYASIPNHERAYLHRRAAEWLERSGTIDPGVMATHFERAGEPRRAAGYAGLAAERSLEAHDYEAVLAWVDQGIQDGAEGDLHGTLMILATEAHKWLGAHERALESAQTALATLPRGSPLWYSAVAEVALAAGNIGNLDRLELAHTLIASARAEGEAGPALVIAEARVALQLLYAGRHDAADMLLGPVDQALSAVAQRDPEVMASVHRVRGFRAMFSGDAGTSAAEFHAAARAFETVGDLRNACIQQVNVGYATIELGAYDQAERALRQALASAERLGLESLTAFARHNLGLALARQGQLYEARAIETQALEAYERQGVRRMAGGSRIYLAMILALGGDVVGAEQHLRLAIEGLGGHPPARAQALATLARVLVLAGRAEEAVGPATEALDLLESIGGIEEGESLVRLEHAVALNATGNRFAARKAILAARDRLLERAQRIQDPDWRQSFLTQVPENARTITLAKAWAPHASPDS